MFHFVKPQRCRLYAASKYHREFQVKLHKSLAQVWTVFFRKQLQGYPSDIPSRKDPSISRACLAATNLSWNRLNKFPRMMGQIDYILERNDLVYLWR